MFLKHKFLIIKLLKERRFLNFFHIEYNMKDIKFYKKEKKTFFQKHYLFRTSL